jgi:8-oxo-dGTP diphosphatase
MRIQNPSLSTIQAAPQRPVNVTAAIILREMPEGTRVLLARRKFDTSLEPGKWEFPGGKLEPLEHPKACLKREINEELGLDIEVGEVFDLASHIYDTPNGAVHILLMCYLCECKSGEFKLIDVADARWVSPDELGNFDYAAADVAVVEKLRHSLSSRRS